MKTLILLVLLLIGVGCGGNKPQRESVIEYKMGSLERLIYGDHCNMDIIYGGMTSDSTQFIMLMLYPQSEFSPTPVTTNYPIWIGEIRPKIWREALKVYRADPRVLGNRIIKRQGSFDEMP